MIDPWCCTDTEDVDDVEFYTRGALKRVEGSADFGYCKRSYYRIVDNLHDAKPNIKDTLKEKETPDADR